MIPSKPKSRIASLVVFAILGLLSSASATLRYVYAVNANDNTISIFSVNPGTGQLRAAGYALSGANPRGGAIAFGRYLYVPNVNSNSIYAYKIDWGTGALSRLAGSYTTGSQPFGMVIHPSGKFLYVANSGSNSISAYSVNFSSGALVKVGTVAAGIQPRGMAVNPTGKYLYVVNYGSHNVSAYVINATSGALTRVPGSPFTSGTLPRDVLVEPKGAYVYVANSGSSNISVYRVVQSTGALAMIGAPALTGKTPRSLCTDSTGSYLYSANRDSNNVSAFHIDRATGRLIPLYPATIAVGSLPRVVRVDPSNKFLFVGHQNTRNIHVLAINPTTGLLKRTSIMQSHGEIMGMTLLSGTSAVSYTPRFLYDAKASGAPGSGYFIDPVSGALRELPGVTFDGSPATVDPFGKFLFTALNGSSPAIRSYSIDQSTGSLRIAATVNFCDSASTTLAVDPSGRFLYVAGNCGLWKLQINRTTGALTSPQGLLASSSARIVAMDPIGRFLVVEDGPTLTLVKIDAVNGTLSYMSSFSGVFSGVTCGGGVVQPLLANEASGRFLYCAVKAFFYPPNGDPNDTTGVAGISISPSTGALSLVPGSPFNVDYGYSLSMTVDPIGTYLVFSAMEGTGRQEYKIESTGRLAVIPQSYYEDEWMAIDCSGRFLYTDADSAFALNRTTGQLTAIAGSAPLSPWESRFVTTCKVQ